MEVTVRDREGNKIGVQEGQTAENQIQNLHEVCQAVGNVPNGRYINVTNGYTLANNAGLDRLN